MVNKDIDCFISTVFIDRFTRRITMSIITLVLVTTVIFGLFIGALTIVTPTVVTYALKNQGALAKTKLDQFEEELMDYIVTTYLIPNGIKVDDDINTKMFLKTYIGFIPMEIINQMAIKYKLPSSFSLGVCIKYYRIINKERFVPRKMVFGDVVGAFTDRLSNMSLLGIDLIF